MRSPGSHEGGAAGCTLSLEIQKEGTRGFPERLYWQKDSAAAKDLAATLGDSLDAWKELTVWLSGKGISAKEWHSISPKYGWALRPQLKARNILYMGPCAGCFRVSFVLGDRAMAAARASELPKAVLKEIAGARRYAEGTGVRLLVRTADDLTPIRTLVEIKLAN